MDMVNVLITGSSRGIGFELMQLFLENNYGVIAVSRSACKGKFCEHSNLTYVKADICTAEGLNSIKEILSVKENLSILINNAGQLINKPFSDINLDELKSVYHTNVFAPFQLIQACLPFMTTLEKSHVVNISSMGGVQGSAKFPGLSAYSSSKMALAGLTEVLAEEYKETKIAFNCLALGAAQTQMLEEAFPGYKAPLSAKEMAQFIFDFATKAHNYINGKIIPVSSSTP